VRQVRGLLGGQGTAKVLTQLAQFDLERGSQFVAAALIDQGLEWLRQSVFGV